MAVSFPSIADFLLLLTTVFSVASASTFAIIHLEIPAVCGIVAGEPNQYIKCFRGGKTISLLPNFSFESISGGHQTFCGLTSGGRSLFCWNIDDSGYTRKLIYNSSTVALTDLTIGGGDQICAREVNSGRARCWRELPFRDHAPNMSFSAISYGFVYACGILTDTNMVKCWGGTELEDLYKGLEMQSLVVALFAESACGNTKTGILVCTGVVSGTQYGQLEPPENSGFEFSDVALSSDYTCAIRRLNGKLTCWGSGVDRAGINVTGHADYFTSINAAPSFLCGLTVANYTVSCWGTGWTESTELPLGTLIPGPCVKIESCKCGVIGISPLLCAGSGVICESCPVQLPPPPPALG